MHFDEGPDQMSHLRLHNGTIWRWNRPLIGFDYDGIPHLRIEHRVVPGGPTVADVIANAALYFGLMQTFTHSEIPLETQIPFARARDNFYAAARDGLDANVGWCEDHKGTVRSLILGQLLPLARRGLEALEIDAADIDRYLGIIESRLHRSTTGAAWQRAYVGRHGAGMQALTEAYYLRQQQGLPVHEWTLESA
jgi:hypothetical protein